MKNLLLLILLLICSCSYAQENTLKVTLLKQLKTTHTEKDWFVPVNVSIEGLTAEQATWKDGSGNHSIGQLTYHLVFWNERQLASFREQKPADFSGNNEETFDAFDKKTWDNLVRRIDAVMTDLEKIVQEADDAKLKKIAGTIANISAHNAYHTGQIIFIRKLQGSWDPVKGVK